MTDKPLYERRDGREPILDTTEKLKDFLQRTNHEDEPQLWKVRWQSRDDKTVYIWYKGEPHIVSSHVVGVLRRLPEPPSLMSRIMDFLFN